MSHQKVQSDCYRELIGIVASQHMSMQRRIHFENSRMQRCGDATCVRVWHALEKLTLDCIFQAASHFHAHWRHLSVRHIVLWARCVGYIAERYAR